METQDLIALALVYAIIAISLLTALLLEKKGVECNIRKVVHIGVGCFVFVWWMFTESWIMLAFFTVPFAIILFLAMLGEKFMPIRELNDLTVNKGHKTGLFFYAVTVSIMVIFFEDHWTADNQRKVRGRFAWSVRRHYDSRSRDNHLLWVAHIRRILSRRGQHRDHPVMGRVHDSRTDIHGPGSHMSGTDR